MVIYILYKRAEVRFMEEENKKEQSKHIKSIRYLNGGTTEVYYQQNLNKCTDVVIGFRIPRFDLPKDDEVCAIYKNKLLFYTNEKGNIYIPIIKPGIPHAVEHMAYSSLPDLNKEDMFDRFVRTNTEFNASTTADSIDFEFNCPSKYLEENFKLFSKLIFRNKYDKEDLKNEKGAITQELLMYKDRTKEGAGDSENVGEVISSINSLTSEEVLGIDEKIISSFTEKEMIKFIKSYFTKQNMIISVVSDLPCEEIERLCDKYFVRKAPSIEATAVRTPKPSYDFFNDKILFVKNPKLDTANINFILRGNDDYESNEIYATIEDFILNNFNGRLLKELRNHNGKVYTPMFGYENLPGLSLKIMTAQTTPENVESVLKTMTDILSDLATNGITDAEYEGFKEMWQNRRERSSSVKFNDAFSLFQKVMYDLPVFVGHYNKKLSEATKEDINNYLKDTYAHAKCLLLLTGNFDDKQINLGEVFKFRPHDKYIDEHLVDKKLEDEFYDYLAYIEQHPNDAKDLTFVVNPVKEKEGKNQKDSTKNASKKSNKKSNKKATQKPKNFVAEKEENKELQLKK